MENEIIPFNAYALDGTKNGSFSTMKALFQALLPRSSTKTGAVKWLSTFLFIAVCLWTANPALGSGEEEFLSDIRMLTDSSLNVEQSCWSPDGTRVAFVNGKSTPTWAKEIWVLNHAGGERSLLLSEKILERHASKWGYSVRDIKWSTSDILSVWVNDNDDSDCELRVDVDKKPLAVWASCEVKEDPVPPKEIKEVMEKLKAEAAARPPAENRTFGGYLKEKHHVVVRSPLDYSGLRPTRAAVPDPKLRVESDPKDGTNTPKKIELYIFDAVKWGYELFHHGQRWFLSEQGRKTVLEFDEEGNKKAAWSLASLPDGDVRPYFRTLDENVFAIYRSSGDPAEMSAVDRLDGRKGFQRLSKIIGIYPEFIHAADESGAFFLYTLGYGRVSLYKYSDKGGVRRLKTGMWHHMSVARDGRRIAYTKKENGKDLLFSALIH